MFWKCGITDSFKGLNLQGNFLTDFMHGNGKKYCRCSLIVTATKGIAEDISEQFGKNLMANPLFFTTDPMKRFRAPRYHSVPKDPLSYVLSYWRAVCQKVVKYAAESIEGLANRT